MKLRSIAFVLCLLCFFMSGCIYSSQDQPENEDTTKNAESEYLQLITSLEEKINKLAEEYYSSDKEKTKELEALRAELKGLIEEETEENEQLDTEAIPQKFTYDITENGGVLTGYLGKDVSVVVPSYIDGIKITSIAESAFKDSRLTTVIISEGVEYIDWFAFFNSPFLTSVTIPSSVTRIGYSAFDGCSSSLTIYCVKDSYAHSYAKSYGISYAFI